MYKILQMCDWGDKEDEDLFNDFDIDSDSWRNESNTESKNDESNSKKREIDDSNTPNESFCNQGNESKNVESHQFSINASSRSKRIIECLEEGSTKRARNTENCESMQPLSKYMNAKSRNEISETRIKEAESHKTPVSSGLSKDFKKPSTSENCSPSTSSSPKVMTPENCSPSTSSSPKVRTPENCFKRPKPKESSKDTPRPAFVRKFPGPAGLLPDQPNAPICTTVEMLNELEKEESQEEYENPKFGEMCSQNTKNLFSEGAWQLMLKDLPPNFLKDDIASVKKNAKSKYRMNKVPFLAGVLKSIDYGHNSPLVTLKDLSDEITGHLHYEIPKMYPDALDCGSVLLLRNVGFVTTTVTEKCYAIISSKSIVAVYSDKARIVTTPFFESTTKVSSEDFQDLGECFDEDFDLEEIMHKRSEKSKLSSGNRHGNVDEGNKKETLVSKISFEDDDNWLDLDHLFDDENEDSNVRKDFPSGEKENLETKNEASMGKDKKLGESSKMAVDFSNNVVELSKVSKSVRDLFDCHDDDELLSQMDMNF